jgi:hypothetical protein
MDAIQKAIENYRNVSGSNAASGQTNGQLVPLSEIVAKQHNQSVSQTTVTSSPMGMTAGPGMTASPAGPALSPVPSYHQPAATTTHTTTYHTQQQHMAPVVPMATMAPMAPAPMVTTNYGYGGATTTTTYTQQPTYVAPTTTYVQTVQPPMMYPQTTFVQPQMTVVSAPPPMIIQQPPTMTFYNPMY